MTYALTSTPSEILELAAAHSEETEAAARLHPSVLDALVRSGLLRQWVAKEYGGAEATIREVLTLIEDFSKADGSTGWCVMIANTSSLLCHHLPAEWGAKIYADPDVCTGGFAAPAGTARVVDGGLEVSGRWSWGSGTDHCTWIGGGVRIVDADGEPTTTADGSAYVFPFFEPSQVEFLDTWHVSGLKGTASRDYRVDRVLVPEGRWANVGGSPVLKNDLAGFPIRCALASGVAAVTIGLAERAIAELILLGENRSLGSTVTLAERTPIQADLARAMANVGQARAYLHEMVERVAEIASNDGTVDDDARATLRLAVNGAAHRSVEAVDLCYHAAGGPAVYETSPLQRVFRDAHVAIAHGMISARVFDSLGSFKFGQPTPEAMLF